MEGMDEKPDIVVAPKALMVRFRNRKLVDADTCIPVGDVEVGVVVRAGVKNQTLILAGGCQRGNAEGR